MSRAHSTFVRLTAEGPRARYALRTSDFGRDNEELAQIVIDTTDGTFQLIPAEPWIRERILPPHLYLLDNFSDLFRITPKLKAYGSGVYSVHILKFLGEIEAKGEFPEKVIRVT